jgi:hypothetical protein
VPQALPELHILGAGHAAAWAGTSASRSNSVQRPGVRLFVSAPPPKQSSVIYWGGMHRSGRTAAKVVDEFDEDFDARVKHRRQEQRQ